MGVMGEVPILRGGLTGNPKEPHDVGKPNPHVGGSFVVCFFGEGPPPHVFGIGREPKGKENQSLLEGGPIKRHTLMWTSWVVFVFFFLFPGGGDFVCFCLTISSGVYGL